ncbi:hypothetical protein SNE40_018482 [Patella caerulea]
MLGIVYSLFFISSVIASNEQCCVHTEFSAVMAEPSLIAKGTRQFTKLAEDFEAKLLATHTFNFVPGTSSTPLRRVVQDFNKLKQYTIYGNTCTVKNIEYEMQGPCIPDDAVVLGSSNMGFELDSIDITSYSWSFANQNATLVMIFTDDCVPLVQAIGGTLNGAPVDTTYVFTQYSNTIADRSIFDIPANCP